MGVGGKPTLIKLLNGTVSNPGTKRGGEEGSRRDALKEWVRYTNMFSPKHKTAQC